MANNVRHPGLPRAMLIALSTRFLAPIRVDELTYFMKSLAYTRKMDLARPVGLKAQNNRRSSRHYVFLARCHIMAIQFGVFGDWNIQKFCLYYTDKRAMPFIWRKPIATSTLTNSACWFTVIFPDYMTRTAIFIKRTFTVAFVKPDGWLAWSKFWPLFVPSQKH